MPGEVGDSAPAVVFDHSTSILPQGGSDNGDFAFTIYDEAGRVYTETAELVPVPPGARHLPGVRGVLLGHPAGEHRHGVLFLDRSVRGVPGLGRGRVKGGKAQWRLPICTYTRNTASWTAPAGSRGCWTPPRHWASRRWPSPTTAVCTAWSIFIRRRKSGASSPFWAARSTWPAAPGSTRSTSWTAKAATWCSCAKTRSGYRNLIALVSKAWVEGFYNKPRVDLELLRQHHQGLIALSACLAGEIPRALSPAGTTPAPRRPPCGTGRSSGRRISSWSSRTTACRSRSASTPRSSGSPGRRASPWRAPTTATTSPGRTARCTRCCCASRQGVPWRTRTPWSSAPTSST